MATRSDGHIPRRRIADDRGIHLNFITNATLQADGRLTASTRGSTRTHIFGSLGESVAAKQLSEVILTRLHINGGTWTSIATLRYHRYLAVHFLEHLDKTHGIDDITDPRLTPTLAWDAMVDSVSHGSKQRNLRHTLADAVRLLRDDGETFATYLFRRSFPTERTPVQAYTDADADLIERIARKRVASWFIRHRDAVRDALGDLPADWLTLDPDHLIQDSDEPCPPAFAVHRADLAAAMVLLAIIDDKGPNLSTIGSYTTDSVERAGDDSAFVTGIKARNHQVLRTPAPAGGLYSFAGLLEFVAAATRVDRHFRSVGTDFDRLLFVATGDNAAMAHGKVDRWWKATLRNDPDAAMAPQQISFRRLRKTAILRAQRRGIGAVIGQRSTTSRLYLADAVPDVILIPGLLNTQTGMTDYWRSKTDALHADRYLPEHNQPSTNALDAAERLAELPEVMDVGVAACASNGQSPTDDTKPCGLGPIACFTCPNGYRTPEVIPGLIAAVQFTDNIRKHEPVEWVTGDAAQLNQLARTALRQFPSQLVDAVPPDAIANSRAIIASVYVEGRRHD